MKLALVMMFANGELPFLKLHLPAYKDAFDGLVAITDPKCTDGGLEYMKAIGTEVMIETWDYNWGRFATLVTDYAEQLGFDAILRLDPDEAIFAEDVKKIKTLLENEATLLCFPRHEFFGDRFHVRTDLYPDHQARSWRLGCGILVQGKRHEGIDFHAHKLTEDTADPDRRVLRVKNPHIWHYGWLGRAGIWRNQIKYQIHAQISAGGPEHVALPPDTPLVKFETVPFRDHQPIDPFICGAIAPWGA